MNNRSLHFLRIILIILLLFGCASTKKDVHEVSVVESRNLQIDSTITADPALMTLVQPYKDDLKQKMEVIIGSAALELSKGKPEAPLNNFIADLMLERANQEFEQGVQVALTNLGGLRTEIPQGPVTLGRIYEVMPFENELVVLEMNGMQLLTLAKEIGEVGGEPISGMVLTFQGENLAKMLVDQKPVENDSIYYLTTTDFLSSPGRNRFAILSTVPRTFLGVTLRDAIIDKVKALDAAGESITAKIEGRISFE
ncbi:MAG: 5'-nucleotidase C-terminal domain-containing protein [bacterium]|nr:MAG: 5'-nucleotidase C-terminal domain-containing protein [bacterium]